jgi:hypothetical protein
VTYDTGILGYDTFGNPTGAWTLVPTGQPLAGTYRTTTTYSSTGLLLDEVPAAGGGLPVDSIALTYDKFGNPITEKGNNTYASAATWTPYNEISQINLGTGPSTAALTYSYNAQNRNITGINLSDQQPSPQVDNMPTSGDVCSIKVTGSRSKRGYHPQWPTSCITKAANWTASDPGTTYMEIS